MGRMRKTGWQGCWWWWWCTIWCWCCTKEQSQARLHPVITVPHYTTHCTTLQSTSGCKIESRGWNAWLSGELERILFRWPVTMDSRKVSGLLGLPWTRTCRCFWKEGRNSGLVGGFRLFAGTFSDPCIRMSVAYSVVKDILAFLRQRYFVPPE